MVGLAYLSKRDSLHAHPCKKCEIAGLHEWMSSHHMIATTCKVLICGNRLKANPQIVIRLGCIEPVQTCRVSSTFIISSFSPYEDWALHQSSPPRSVSHSAGLKSQDGAFSLPHPPLHLPWTSLFSLPIGFQLSSHTGVFIFSF